jgi:hypothetical protein
MACHTLSRMAGSVEEMRLRRNWAKLLSAEGVTSNAVWEAWPTPARAETQLCLCL